MSSDLVDRPDGQDTSDRRRRLIDAAFELGAEGGYDAVHMREVAAHADVAMATLYRHFSSKDDLLAAAMTEWVERLGERVSGRPPRGDSATEQMMDVLERACSAMARQPKLSRALIRALSSSDPRTRSGGGAVRSSIAEVAEPILSHIDEETRGDILAIIGHVWYSSLIVWANDHADFDLVIGELRRTCRVLLGPFDRVGSVGVDDAVGRSRVG